MENNSIINESTLNDLMLSLGEKVDHITTVPKEKIAKRMELAYDNNSPIPGEDVSERFDSVLDNINPNSAMNDVLSKAALVKAKKEGIEQKLEQAKIRKQFIDSMVYQQGEAFYEKYHYMMDGQTKRRIRKKIEREYDAGKYSKKSSLNG